METKQYVCFEVVKNDNVYRLMIPGGSGYGELYDAVFEMLNETVKLAQEAAQQAHPEQQKAHVDLASQ